MKSKNINIILIIIIIILIIVPTLLSVKKNHDDNLWKVTNKRVEESALKCKNESICTDDIVTLEFLINKGYLDTVVNPITKEVINNNSYYDFTNNEFKIIS